MNPIASFSRTLISSFGVVAMLISGCANMTDAQRSAAIGAGVGGLAGAVIGDSKGAVVVGAGVGALGGYVWSTQMAKKKAAMEQATAGTGVAVTQTPDNQLKLNIPSDISFDTGQSTIRPIPMFALWDTPTARGLTPSTIHCLSTVQQVRATIWLRAA